MQPRRHARHEITRADTKAGRPSRNGRDLRFAQQQGARRSRARSCSATKRGLPAARAEPGVVTTPQHRRPRAAAKARAARAVVAEARPDLDVSVEKDELGNYTAAYASCPSSRSRKSRSKTPHFASIEPPMCAIRSSGWRLKRHGRSLPQGTRTISEAGLTLSGEAEGGRLAGTLSRLGTSALRPAARRALAFMSLRASGRSAGGPC
jgi:hypothetical protein